MLDRIIHFSIKNKLIIGLFTLALIGWGSYSVTQLPIDAVPDITNNQVQVLTVSPSLAAQEVERLITFPVEVTMANIPGIEEIRSFSRFGLSVVTIVFKDNIDVYWARQQVSERLIEAERQIPQGIGKPELAPVTTGLSEIYQYVLHTKKGYEEKYTAMDLRTIQDWIVRRQLFGTEGVADVSSFGGYLKQYEIAVDPDKLRSMNISISDIFNALEKNNQNTGGAYINKNPNSYFIRSEGLIEDLADIERIVVSNRANGIPVLIRNVATVQFGNAVRYGAMTRNTDGEVVGGLVLMLKGENASKVIKNVKEKVATIEKNLPEGVVIEPFLDRTKLVNNAIGTVTRNLAEGALIVIFVLVLLLGNMRAGLLVASVIPLSMLFAISMMNLFGVSGNLMSLGAIDFGLIVDGAVIIVEAIVFQIALRSSKGTEALTGQQMDEEVYVASSKIRNSAAFGEIIILIVYLPIMALLGVEGKMFKPMAQTVSFAIIGAFILSLTYVPMMASLVLSRKPKHKRNISDKIIDRLHKYYEPLIQASLRRKGVILISSFLLFILSIIVFYRLGGEFIPTLEEGDFAVETRIMTGSSLDKTVQTTTKAAEILLKQFPEIKEIVGKIGSAEIPTDPMPIESADLMIILKDRNEWTSADNREELAEKMGKALAVLPGVTFGFQQPIQMRFNELMTGARQDVVIKIYGEDLDVLTDYAAKIGKLIRPVEGAEDLYIEEVTGLPQIVVKLDRDKIAQFGLSVEDINRTINTGFAGESAGLIFEGEKRFDLVVRLDKENRQGIEDVKNLYITTPHGEQIPLNQVATVEFKEGPNQIQRDDTKRRITIGFNVRNRDVESIVEEITEKIESNVKLPPGYYVTYGGQFENLVQARSRLLIAVPVALLLIFILLFFTFHSFKQSLLIFSAIPLAAIGGIFALWLRGMPFSISAGVGFIALFGVAVLNGIVLISYFNELKKEGMSDIKERILKGTAVRLRPVIMTATVASLGFLPMALSNSAGAEVQKPLATVVIGGLISATLLTLFVLPVLYSISERWGEFGKRKTNIKRGLTVSIVLIIIASSFSVHAQRNPVEKYTLQQTIQAALENNGSLKSAEYDLEASKVRRKTAVDLGKTNVDLIYGQYNSLNNDNNITISQSFSSPFLYSSASKLARENIESSEINLRLTENELIKNVKSNYYNLAYLLSRQKLLKYEDSLFTQVLRASELRFKTGETNLLEKANSEVQKMQIENELSLSEGDIAIYKKRLETLIQSESFSIADTTLPKLTLNVDTTSIEGSLHLKHWAHQMDVTKAERKLEQSKLTPDFNFGFFSQTLIGNHSVDGQEVYYSGSKRFTGIQAGVSIPLWFRPQAARISASKINEQIAGNNYHYKKVALSGELQILLEELKKNQKSLDFYERSALPQAELILEHAEKSFRAGAIGYLEYTQSITRALDIKTKYLESLNANNQTIISIEFITGNK